MNGFVLSIHPVVELRNGYLIARKKLRDKMERIVPKLIEEFAEAQVLDKEFLWLEYTLGLSEEVKQVAEDTAKRLGFLCHSGIYGWCRRCSDW